MTASDATLKTKYAPQRELAANREGVALAWLRLMGLADAAPVGNGTGTSESLATWHSGLEDKFDFYSPSCEMFFEVSGTSWLKSQSERRMGKATLAVLKVKVDDAERYNVADRLVFVAVADQVGEIRFMPCPNVRWYSLCTYAQGEQPYYAIPWKDWLEPCHIIPRLCKARVSR
jgi:hypothetical protein